MTRRQLARFAEVDRAVIAAGAPVRVRHAANSSAALLFPGGAVRSRAHRHRDLRQRSLGDSRSHGRCASSPRSRSSARSRRAHRSATARRGTRQRDSRVAILPCGYADGLPRSASGHAEVAIRGKRVPLVGLDQHGHRGRRRHRRAGGAGRRCGGAARQGERRRVDHARPSTARGAGSPSTKSRAG